jgi:glycerol-3-phosphate dehydrogenase
MSAPETGRVAPRDDLPAPQRRRRDIAALASETFDLLVIGGGATGLGVAVDAASRGLRIALVEAHDLAQGTSSRSTKLVHGGVRYLEQLDIGLVREALHERGVMAQNAPHLVHDLRFVVPRYSWWEAPFYGAGLKIYDALAGSRNLGPSHLLSRDETIAAIPNVQREGLLGGVAYHDAQFDDARMAVTLALTARDHGAVVVTQCRVTGLLRDAAGRISGATVVDRSSLQTIGVRARVVVNATGIFADTIRRMEAPQAAPVIEPAQGVHLVLPRIFQPSESAIMVPHTDDGRVLFVIPWHDRVLVGTTDTPMDAPAIEPRALEEEIEFILRNAVRYLERDATRRDVLSVFAGQRPLVHAARANETHGAAGASGRGEAHGADRAGTAPPVATKSISRHHEVLVGPGAMVTIVGGKWTTYRRMAEDTVDRAIAVGEMEPRPCRTNELRLHGWLDRGSRPAWSLAYGSDFERVERVLAERPEWSQPMEARLPYPLGVAAWSVRVEDALHLEDVLARRTRALLLDARAAMACAERVARVMAGELGRDEAWIVEEVNAFVELARGYLPSPGATHDAGRHPSAIGE